MAGASMDSGKDHNAFVAQPVDQQHEEAPGYAIHPLNVHAASEISFAHAVAKTFQPPA